MTLTPITWSSAVNIIPWHGCKNYKGAYGICLDERWAPKLCTIIQVHIREGSREYSVCKQEMPSLQVWLSYSSPKGRLCRQEKIPHLSKNNMAIFQCQVLQKQPRIYVKLNLYIIKRRSCGGVKTTLSVKQGMHSINLKVLAILEKRGSSEILYIVWVSLKHIFSFPFIFWGYMGFFLTAFENFIQVCRTSDHLCY